TELDAEPAPSPGKSLTAAASRTAEPLGTRTIHNVSEPIVTNIDIAANINALITRFITINQYNTLYDRCARKTYSNNADTQAGIEHLETAAVVSGIGAAVLVGLGATLYFFVDKHVE